jgi:hypothetical protein
VPDRELCLKSHDEDEVFTVRVFKFYAPRTNKSKISLVAHRREVTDVTIQMYIPEFADEFYDKAGEGESGKDRNYIIKAYVFGGYLDSNVSLERGAFNFQKDNDLVDGISQSQIEELAATIAQEAVGQEIAARRAQAVTHQKLHRHRSTMAPGLESRNGLLITSDEAHVTGDRTPSPGRQIPDGDANPS